MSIAKKLRSWFTAPTSEPSRPTYAPLYPVHIASQQRTLCGIDVAKLKDIEPHGGVVPLEVVSTSLITDPTVIYNAMMQKVHMTTCDECRRIMQARAEFLRRGGRE